MTPLVRALEAGLEQVEVQRRGLHLRERRRELGQILRLAVAAHHDGARRTEVQLHAARCVRRRRLGRRQQVPTDEPPDLGAQRLEAAVPEHAQVGERLREHVVAERARRPRGEVVRVLAVDELVLEEVVVHVVADAPRVDGVDGAQQLVEVARAGPGRLDQVQHLLEHERLGHRRSAVPCTRGYRR